MPFLRSFRLTLCALLLTFITSVCSSGYITPNSLAATQQMAEAQAATAGAFVPSATPTEQPSVTATDEANATPLALPSATMQATASNPPPYIYTAQSGDTLAALAVRFGVDADQIASPQDISQTLINAGQIFTVPNVLGATSPHDHLLPDSEVVYSPSAIGFDSEAYEVAFAGYLMTYREYLPMQWFDGPGVVERVATENSLNPRLLLSILQYQSDWVLGEPKIGSSVDYPIGRVNPSEHGLYHQLTWAAKQLSTGYYGWREGRLTELTFPDGIKLRIAPDLNAGSVAIQFFFSQLYNYVDWLKAIDKNNGFPFTHSSMFPDPWVRAAQTEPLFPPDLSQPALSLPFFGNQIWYFTSGPHGAWEREGAMAALDFAPSSTLPGCTESDYWVTAAAPGLVVRSSTGIVVVDMDGDGNEQTGWVILYLHVEHDGTAKVGDWVDRGDRLGHPSCKGGIATGTHLHIARKYNGEWISAGGPVPFDLSGWIAAYGAAPYLGSLSRDGDTVTACTCSGQPSKIARSSKDPY
jgi:murein DD-endopeptidase MepM/ murein hydrolase activator NlpD